MHTIEVTPNACLVCGRGNTPNGDDGTRPTFVDLERDVNWNDPAILCEDCVVKAGALIGMQSPDDIAGLQRQIEDLKKDVHTHKTEIDSLHRRFRQRSAREKVRS